MTARPALFIKQGNYSPLCSFGRNPFRWLSEQVDACVHAGGRSDGLSDEVAAGTTLSDNLDLDPGQATVGVLDHFLEDA